MTVYAPDVFVFDVVPPRQYVGWDAYKKDWQDVFASMPGPVTNTVVDLDVTVVGSVAYTHYINDGTMTDKDGKQVHMVARSTDVLRKKDGKWLIVEEHNSLLRNSEFLGGLLGSGARLRRPATLVNHCAPSATLSRIP
jgi:ketosteroid isomerase-like protein